MSDTSDDLLGFLRPTPQKPLLGQTILAVEDSRCAGEALRLLSLHSGARFRRADSVRAAHRHLSTYRPTVVICDIGLPDGSGLGLLTDLVQARLRVPALIGMSGDPGLRDRALAAGADAFIDKPVVSLAAFRAAVVAALPTEHASQIPLTANETTILADPDAVADDLAHAADLLSSAEAEGTADYVAGLVSGIGLFAGDRQLVEGAARLKRALVENQPFAQPLAALSGLVHRRIMLQHAAG